VVIEEINEELLKNTEKADGSVLVLLLRAERLRSFEKMWKEANLDYY